MKIHVEIQILLNKEKETEINFENMKKEASRKQAEFLLATRSLRFDQLMTSLILWKLNSFLRKRISIAQKRKWTLLPRATEATAAKASHHLSGKAAKNEWTRSRHCNYWSRRFLHISGCRVFPWPNNYLETFNAFQDFMHIYVCFSQEMKIHVEFQILLNKEQETEIILKNIKEEASRKQRKW